MILAILYDTYLTVILYTYCFDGHFLKLGVSASTTYDPSHGVVVPCIQVECIYYTKLIVCRELHTYSFIIAQLNGN